MSANELTQLVPKTVVAKVISDSRLVISRGSDDGVKLAQTYLVYALGEELKDPNDGRSLGNLEIVRGRGKVVHLQEKMATLQSIEVHRSTISKTGGGGYSFLRAVVPELNETITEAPFVGPELGDLCRPV